MNIKILAMTALVVLFVGSATYNVARLVEWLSQPRDEPLQGGGSNMSMRNLVAAVCILVCSCTPADPFEVGLEAHKAKDYTTALAKWKPLAEQGNADAQTNLGIMHEFGQGVMEDHKEAVKWYLKAAEQGHAGGQRRLGVMYYNGKGVPQDYKEAASWYRKAAEQGNADAQTNLGIMYERGRGVVEDHKEAVKWYLKAVEQNQVDAQFNLGLMYYNGKGTSQDYKESVNWFRKAADQGDADAKYTLGVMYYKGNGVPQDYKEAASWYRKAAEQNHVDAQNNLGVMYHGGKGVPQDDVLAYMLYNLAAAGGDKTATDNRAYLARQLSREQVEEAQALSSKWKPGTALPTESKTGQVASAGKKASNTSVTTAARGKECSPPAGRSLRYSDRCTNGDCIRTFENGCQKRFQAPYCYDSLEGRWTWKPDGC